MDEGEAALLAELRAISNQSAAGNRFAEEDNGDEKYELPQAAVASAIPEPEEERKIKSPIRLEQPQVSPKTNVNEQESVSKLEQPRKEEPQENVAKADNGFQQKSTFAGTRGGPAEDAELLAELQAISNQSASTDRFSSTNGNDDDDNDVNNNNNNEATEIENQSTMSSENKRHVGNSSSSSPKELPPWKQKRDKQQNKPWRNNNINSSRNIGNNDNDDDVIIAAPPPPKKNVDSAVLIGGGGNFKQESTFTGDRGGAAEDEELLAELRNISAKSSGMDRFSGNVDDDDGDDKAPYKPISTTKAVPQPSSKPDKEVPPWKRKNQPKQQIQSDEDVIVAAPPPAVKLEEESINQAALVGGGNFKQESTFNGERGGAAEDEELLALLRGVSAKSGAADRFANSNDVDEEPGKASSTQDQGAVDDVVVQSKPPPQRTANKSAISLPPWKRDKAQASKNSADVDVLVAAPTSQKQQQQQQQPQQPEPANHAAFAGGVGNFKQESSFTGERGGAAEDADLLVLLRGVSAKSGASDRFASGEEEEIASNVGEQVVVEDAVVQSKPLPKRTSNKNASTVPPWKRGKAQASKSSADIVVAAAPPPPTRQEPEERVDPSALAGGAGNFKQESTFNGERGGAAEDEELLALLRGVSAKSGAADRFAGRDDEGANVGPPKEQGAIEDVVVQSKPPPRSPRNKTASVPPWKSRKVQAPNKSADVEVVVASAPPPTRQEPEEPINPSALGGGAGNFKQESSFSGERGGAAEDEELLALLRGVSAKSGASDRFANSDDQGASPGIPQEPNAEDVVVQSKPPPRRSLKNKLQGLWNGGKSHSQDPMTDDVVVAAAPPHTRQGPEEPINQAALAGGAGNFKHESTFSGERGGAAEDAELLALLRGVSNKSGGVDRFADESSPPDGEPKKMVQSPPKHKPTPQASRSTRPNSNEIPPWKRGKAQNESPKEKFPQQSAEEPKGDFKSKSTFTGERGGAAEDAELLALLRGVSSKSGGDRFADDAEDATMSAPKAQPAPQRPVQVPRSPAIADSSSPVPTGIPSNGDDAIVVTKENVHELIIDKDWKARKAAYLFLNDMISTAGGNNPTGELDGNAVFTGVDELIASFLMDKNANALDGALEACLTYTDYCTGGSSFECAQKMTTALIKGNGFTSPRPTAAKIAKALEIKLMEVGSSAESLKAVVGVLLELGVTSRKPKIVQISSSLILEAAYSFGAACLPLAAVSEALPKLLAHTNKNVRDTAMEIVAEFCRALGSKGPMNAVIEKMKKTQVKDLDALLEKQPAPTPLKVGFRSQRKEGADGEASAAPEDTLAALQADAKELEAERFARRPAVNLMEAIKKTDYAAKLKLAKWSEKVAGMKIVLECGGEQPYKLAQPSPSCNYAPLVHEMKGILSHTHYLVVSKAMEVLAMLAEGVGEKLYPNLRPLLPQLLSLSKDKKLIKGVSACLDSFFGNVLGFEHLLDPDAALPEGVKESKTKNALARAAALDFLGRCIERIDSAGPRSHLKGPTASGCANLCSEKLSDSDANVRKSALATLKALQKVDDPAVMDRVDAVVGELESSNLRAFKALAGDKAKPKVSPKAGVSSPSRKPNLPSPPRTRESPRRTTTSKPSSPPKKTTSKAPENPFATVINDDGNSDECPDLETATSRCASLSIPNWDAEDDEGGVRAGVESTNWKYRFEALKALASFVASREVLAPPSDIEMDTACILVFVKEHTRGFKETNVNVTKSILELFLALCDYHEKAELLFPTWAGRDGSIAAVEKIADKKLSALSKNLLLSLCVVRPPDAIHSSAFTAVGNLKSPVAHEEFLKWFKLFCNEFGASSIGPGIYTAVAFLVEFTKTRNMKVNKAALSALGTMHTHLGPTFQAVALAAAGNDQSLRDQLDKTFKDHPYDRSAASSEWPKRSLSSVLKNPSSSHDNEGTGLTMEVPKMDLMSEIPSDCLVRMGSKDGKTAWKARKAAMEDVESALKRCTGLLDTSRPKPLVDLLRALKERLSDSQSNLKPVAARLIGSILSSVDKTSQGRMGKVVYGSLINAAMNDNKKNMHDAAMEALTTGTSLAPLDGEGLNEQSLEAFVNALVGELEESEFKAGGIADVLSLTQTFTVALPNLDDVASQRGESLGGKFSAVLVDALSSSKSETRAASEALLFDCVKRGVISVGTVKKCISRLKPASQRSLGSMMTKLSSLSGEDDISEPMEEKRSVSKSLGHSVSSERSDRGTKPKSAIPLRASSRKVVDSKRTYSETPASQLEPKQHTSGPAANNHPLIFNTAGNGFQKSRSAMKLLTWPEYPEEPSGNNLLNGLKKAWAPLIPPESLKKLFPDGGIRKQDDATGGCELLSRAIALERAGDGCAIVEQFNLILKWAAFVLCCKESPVGQQALVSFLSELFDFLRESKYELSDSETLIIIPMILDKASVAKGRFKDSFADLVEQVKCDDLLPPKRMGPIVCVALIEASSHPKATLLACKECYNCVENIGLSGIGKRGVIATAKALSEAKLIDNRSALLELMALVLSRMNGDMQRLNRICGSSLSTKARDLLEEKVKKSEKGAVVGASTASRSGIPAPSAPSEASSRRRMSRLPTSVKMTPNKAPASSIRSTSKLSPPTLRSETPRQMYGDAGPTAGFSSSFCDELPALDLRAGLRESTPTTASGIPEPTASAKRSPSFTSPTTSILASPRPQHEEPTISVARSLSFNGSDNSMNHDREDSKLMTKGNPSETTIASATSSGSLAPSSVENSVDNGPSSSESSLGAAASLRARLMKIREKNKLPTSDDRKSQDTQDQCLATKLPSTTPKNEPPVTASMHEPSVRAQSPGLLVSPHERDEEDIRLEDELDAILDDGADSPRNEGNKLDEYLATIQALLTRDLPVEEDDHDVISSTDVLKSIHAAVSKQSNLAIDLDAVAVTQLRDDIKARATEVISILTTLIDFGFNCHSKSCNAGISVPLLSVNLAGLMAIFRSEDLSKLAEVSDLTMLIKEAGKALLDPRLGSSGSALDEATSTQMVRAINKLAVQAATGATRHVAFQALIALQLQLTMGTDGLDDALYRSRLSRVVTKLFMRVVKAEESTFKPFSSASLDVEALLCCLEDSLVACQKVADQGQPQDGIEASRHLAKVLVLALMRERGDASTLLLMMEELEIDTYTSALGELMSSCAAELGYSYTKPAPETSQDISALVSAVGSARDGAERDLAVDALRQYTEANGNEGLNTHLSEVSSTFRAFILEQLNGSNVNNVEEPSSKVSTSSMSERIKNLRSKINATEAVVQSAVDTSERQNDGNVTGVLKSSPMHQNSATPNQGDDVPSSSVLAFRERLALAQEKRTSMIPEPATKPDVASASGNRAAALRARLQAVKRQAGQS